MRNNKQQMQSYKSEDAFDEVYFESTGNASESEKKSEPREIVSIKASKAPVKKNDGGSSISEETLLLSAASSAKEIIQMVKPSKGKTKPVFELGEMRKEGLKELKAAETTFFTNKLLPK